MPTNFFDLAAQFAASVEDDDPATLYAKLLDTEGKEHFSRELSAVFDQEKQRS